MFKERVKNIKTSAHINNLKLNKISFFFNKNFNHKAI